MKKSQISRQRRGSLASLGRRSGLLAANLKSQIKSCWIVIPAFNEATRIKEVIVGVQKFTKNIIVVDDGSKDGTYDVARKTGATVLRHELNLGKGMAMKTGVKAAWLLGAEAVILLDADGQHNPNHIPEFIKKISAGFDIVFGNRNLGANTPILRLLGSKLGALLVNLFFGIYRYDMLCGFISFTREAYKKIEWESSRYGVETEIVARTGKNKLKYAEVPIETIYLDKYKGVTIFDSLGVLFNLPRWLLR